MSKFIELNMIGTMSRNKQGSITIAIDSIAYFREDPGYGTKIHMKDGQSHLVFESPEKVRQLITEAQ